MNEQLQILPLALIMVMGPQILTAIFLVTSKEPVKNSVAMLIGVVVAASLSIAIWFGLVRGPRHQAAARAPGRAPPTTWSRACWRWRAFTSSSAARHASVPKWMSALQKAEPKRALSLGFLLILLMPTDIVAVISTVHWLHDNHDNRLARLAARGGHHAADGPADPRLPAARAPRPRRDARHPRLADHATPGWSTWS